MADQSTDTSPSLSEGVDEEPVESNRRLFTGSKLALVATMATLYAAFHMAALNGLSISEWTGVTIPFLPTFPMETWNFRIVHAAPPCQCLTICPFLPLPDYLPVPDCA